MPHGRDPPGSGIKLMSPALRGGFLTTAPSGKSRKGPLDKGAQKHTRIPTGLIQGHLCGLAAQMSEWMKSTTAKQPPKSRGVYICDTGLCTCHIREQTGRQIGPCAVVGMQTLTKRLWSLCTLRYTHTDTAPAHSGPHQTHDKS